jgi:hypothetical protein
MTAAEIRRRMIRLGYRTPGEAARALGVPRSSLHRMWHGERRIQARTARLVELLEAAQPARMTPLMQRALLTSAGGKGAQVHEPERRSVFDKVDWAPVFAELAAGGLVAVWGRQYVLTEMGARCVAFLRQTQGQRA